MQHMAKAFIDGRILHSDAKRKARGHLPVSELKEFITFMWCVLNGTAILAARQWKKNFLRYHKDWLALGQFNFFVQPRWKRTRAPVIFCGPSRSFSMWIVEDEKEGTKERNCRRMSPYKCIMYVCVESSETRGV